MAQDRVPELSSQASTLVLESCISLSSEATRSLQLPVRDLYPHSHADSNLSVAGRGKLKVEQGIWSSNDPRLGGSLAWGSFLLTALKAQLCYTRNRDYICKGGEVIIISDATGRLVEKSRWTAEIHQVCAVELPCS